MCCSLRNRARRHHPLFEVLLHTRMVGLRGGAAITSHQKAGFCMIHHVQQRTMLAGANLTMMPNQPTKTFSSKIRLDRQPLCAGVAFRLTLARRNARLVPKQRRRHQIRPCRRCRVASAVAARYLKRWWEHALERCSAGSSLTAQENRLGPKRGQFSVGEAASNIIPMLRDRAKLTPATARSISPSSSLNTPPIPVSSPFASLIERDCKDANDGYQHLFTRSLRRRQRRRVRDRQDGRRSTTKEGETCSERCACTRASSDKHSAGSVGTT